MSQTYVLPMRYAVSAVPLDYALFDSFVVDVERRGGDQWVAMRRGNWLRLDGSAAGERSAECLTDLDTALYVARRVAPLLTVNGLTVPELLAKGKNFQ